MKKEHIVTVILSLPCVYMGTLAVQGFIALYM